MWQNLAQTGLAEVMVLGRRPWNHFPNFPQSFFVKEILKDQTWGDVTSDPVVEASGCYVDSVWERQCEVEPPCMFAQLG